MNAFGLGTRHRRVPGTVAAAALASIDAAGWSALWASGTPSTFTPDAAPQTIAVIHAGFDATGTTTSYAGARTFTRRVRQVYPNQASDAPSTIALDDYVYATDTIPGVTNNSTEVSPKPIAAWVMPGRQLVGNSLHWELVAFHRDFRANRQVACVIVTASDGTNSVSQTVSATAISTLAEDANPIEVYAGDLDITGLATGLVTLNAKVYPWIGGAASVLDSAASSVPREFSPRYFLKNAARFAAPPLAYVASGGSDSTGLWSTDPVAASAAPFASVKGALDAVTIAAQGGGANGATGGIVDGCRIRVNGTSVLASAAVSRTQNVAALIIERDPAVARSGAAVTLSASFNPKLALGLVAPLAEGALMFRDITVNRTANTSFAGASGVATCYLFWNVAFANTALGTWLSNSHDYIFGMSLTGFNSNLGQSNNGQHRLLRGLTVDVANTGGLEAWVTLGCAITRALGVNYADVTKGAIFYANQYRSPASTVGPITLTDITTPSGAVVTGVAIVQNLIEVTHTNASTIAIGVSHDTPIHGDTVHVILAYNTITGYASAGRSNVFYDNNGGAEVRAHRLMRGVGNIHVQLNTKGDVFVATSGGNPTDAPNHVGQFAFHHGVGCQGNLSQFRVGSGTPLSEYQAYPGLGSLIGADPNTAQFAPGVIWTDYRGTTGSGGTAVAGAGGGTYTLASGSPAKGMVTRPGLAFDLAGVGRGGASDAAGAYA